MPTRSDPPTSRTILLNTVLLIDPVRTACCRLRTLALLWTKEVPQVPLILPEEPSDTTLTPDQVARMNRAMQISVNQEYQELQETSRADTVLGLFQMVCSANTHAILSNVKLVVALATLSAEVLRVQVEFNLALDAQELVTQADLNTLKHSVSVLHRAALHGNLLRGIYEQFLESEDEMLLYAHSLSPSAPDAA